MLHQMTFMFLFLFTLLCFLIKVLPNMDSIVDIKAVSYDVCGVVQMASSGYKAKV